MTTTTLLDYIQKSKVTAFEAGGITQGIGAYKVSVPIDGKSQQCVFLSTPGHEAFGAMRARGARVIDIVIIVVAADDGIHPQTNEAIAHAKATSVPIMIVVNKIDKDGANPECVMQELASIGLMLENWGGDVLVISALKWENMDELLETIMLVAELQDLKANPYRSAKGTIIEASFHKSKEPGATFIMQNGTLKRGDVVVCGEAFGKVRAIFDDQGNHVDEAGPSIPVQNFDDVLVPEDHVSRSYNDTYYVDSQTVLRCHISAHQAELLRKGHTHFLVTGDVYRRDSIDSTHYPIFHQMERFWVFTPDDWEPSGMDGTSYVAEDLKKCIEGLARHLFGTV